MSTNAHRAAAVGALASFPGLPFRRCCRECGNSFLAVRHDQVFCKPPCRRAWHSWREGQGARAVELLIKWRRERRRGSFTALAALADELVRDQFGHKAKRGTSGRQGG